MTSARAPVPPVDLKARIAALQLQQAANSDAAAKSGTSQTLPKANAVNGANALRDRIASFEKQGAVPKPKGRFGFAPPVQQDPNSVKRGELYGNRVPGLSRPHLPVPTNAKSDTKPTRSRSRSRLEELERFATSPSPPASPFAFSDNGDSVGDMFSDGDADSPSNNASQEEAQQASLDALVSQVGGDAAPEVHGEVTEAPTDAPQEPDAPVAVETVGPATDQTEKSSTIGDAPSEPTADVPPRLPSPAPEAELPVPAEPEPPVPPESEPAPEPEPVPASVLVNVIPAPEVPPAKPAPIEGLDPAVQAVIDELDRATRNGDAGSVVVPADTLQTLGLAPQQTGSTVADLLDQLLLQEDVLDIATPVKQRFSLRNSLSSIAVRNYINQQAELAAKDSKSATTPEKKAEKVSSVANTSQSNQFLSSDSPIAEPLSPTSDIYSAYLTATPAVPYSRALPAIPEGPDSPLAFKQQIRRGTFGMDSESSTPPSSVLLPHSSDNGSGSISPGDGSVRLGNSSPPPLSVVIPGTVSKQHTNDRPGGHAPSPVEAVIVTDAQRVVSPTVTRGVLVPAPQSASDSSTSSPLSSYSLGSIYSATSPSSSGPVSRKVSRSSKSRSKAVSPPPPLTPYEEPALTPLEGPKGFHAVVHEKVVEGKSRPVSIIQQYEDLPSPTPMNASNMSDLAALLADAQKLEQRLADARGTPQKKAKALPPRPAPPSTSTPPPPVGRSTPDRRGTPNADRPRPVQDLPESPDDGDNFGRLSQETSMVSRASTISRTSQYDRSSQYAQTFQYESRPLPARPSADRTIERKVSRPSFSDAARPSLDRVSSRTSLDQTGSARPSVDSHLASRPQLQPLFLSADPNTVRIPLPPRPKSAAAGSSVPRSQTSTPPVPRSQASTPPVPPLKGSPKTGTGYLSNLLSRAKSSGNLRQTPDSRDSVGSSSEDSVMVSTPPTPPYEMIGNDTGSVRSSRMFKNSFSRASNFADRLLHRKDGSNQVPDVAIASGDEDDGGLRALPRPPRPLPLPPRPQPPRGLPPPVPGEPQSSGNLQPLPPPGQPSSQRRGSWKSLASVSTTDISAALDNIGMSDNLPPEPIAAAPVVRGLPPGPNAYTSPRPAPQPPLPPPNQPLPPPPPNQPLPAPPRGASRGLPPAGYGLPSNPSVPRKSLPARPKLGQPGQLRSGMI
ncbi:hypothetical protein BD309DRAFT_499539 [Dichomitus squalens]|uniref:Uncharacterized protein n=1 Tax=Dichomitus squalens TaxID=114155 RepID=A0A4Q9PDJ0_9APHY|nr:hypothetical protein BD309DRAFT_499539 [Dichomitus squalens]TBU65414.1 hypothetical protein BD310DRAFT_7264 [Dichomitus squalens]